MDGRCRARLTPAAETAVDNRLTRSTDGRNFDCISRGDQSRPLHGWLEATWSLLLTARPHGQRERRPQAGTVYRVAASPTEIAQGNSRQQQTARLALGSRFGKLECVTKCPTCVHTEPFLRIAAPIERSIGTASKVQSQQRLAAARGVARPAGLEPATLGLEGRCSIH